MPNSIGGSLLAGAGGYINIYQYATSNYATLDVAEWQMEYIPKNKAFGHSGSFGATNRRRTGLDYKVLLKVFWDARFPPESRLLTGDSVGLVLTIGDGRAWAAMGYNYQARWVSPSALASRLIMTNNSEGDDIVTETWILEGNSHIFLLPYHQEAYDQYMAFLINRGEG
jgi:hypothetical protein